MKSKNLLILISVVFFFSCNSTTQDQPLTVYDTLYNVKDSAMLHRPDRSIWTMEYDSILKRDRMIQIRKVSSDTLTPEKLITILNDAWPDVHMDLKRIGHDTIYITIPDSHVLTGQMGTTGSNHYMSATIYTLTELKGIKWVNFDFEEGDHAIPGTYGRSW